MKLFLGALEAIDWLSESTGKLASLLIIPLTGVMVYEVIMRYVLARPTIFALDMSWMFYGAFAAMGGAYCHLHRGHVRVDLFYNLLPPRGRAIFEVVLYLIFFFPLFYVLIRYCAENVIFAWTIGETAAASIWRPPVYPFKTVVLVGLVLLLLQGIAEFGRHLYIAMKGITPDER